MNVIDQITDELTRATAKFLTWPTDPLHALAVLGEEYGELTKAMLQLTYEPHKTSAEDVREEAIQTAAMALRLAMSLDRYEYRRGEQHSQGYAPKGGCGTHRWEWHADGIEHCRYCNEARPAHQHSSEGDRFIGRDIREIEALAANGLREDGLPD